MLDQNIQKSNKIKDLQTSKIILSKLINHYSYNSIVDYLFNPDKISNPKLESIMKRLINKMGINNLAFLLCSENLNSNNLNKEKEEEKSMNKNNNNNINNGHNKYKTFLIKKKYKHKILNREKKYKKNFLFHKYFNHKKSRNISLDEDESSNDKNSFDSFNNMNNDSDKSDNDNSDIESDSSKESENNKSQNSYNNSYCNDFDEFCDSEINRVNIINLVNEMEEEEESNKIKEEDIKKDEEEKKEKQIILDETNSYVCKIIYKTKSGELNYFCFEKFNEDNTITMHCIDESCKSKGMYNTKNKQIIIITEHSIEYEAHCFFKINFGGKELDLEIFDFIKDSPEVTGIEILKSKDNIKIKEENKEEEKNMVIEEENKKEKKSEDENEDVDMEIKKEKEDEDTDINNDKNSKIEEDNNNENNLNIKEETNYEKDEVQDKKNNNSEKEEKEINIKNEPIYQNRICNNITQIIKKVKNKEKVNTNEKKETKENFTLFNLNFNINTNNIRTTKPNNIRHNEHIKEIDFIQKNDIKNSSTDSNKLTNDESNNYNFVEFNIDNIIKLEGTENCYSKKVDQINIENKKLVEEEKKLIEKNKRNKSKTGLGKLKEKINQHENNKNPNNNPNNNNQNIDKNNNQNNNPNLISHSSSPSYLINEEIKETENELDETESQYSKLSVISHFHDKEEKIIIEENDSFFSSLDILSLKEREKYNKRINDEIISISEDYSEKRRKHFEKMKKKLQENHLRKYLKKKEPQRRSLFRVNERKIRDEDEVIIPNKRKVFGITRRSMSPMDIRMEKIEEEEIKEKVIEDENVIHKKGMPIFGIFNPNKHNPIFFINNNFNKK